MNEAVEQRKGFWERILPPPDKLDHAAMMSFLALKSGEKRRAVNRGYIDIFIGHINVERPRSPAQQHRSKVKDRTPGTVSVLRRVHLPGLYYGGAPRGMQAAVCGDKLEYFKL